MAEKVSTKVSKPLSENELAGLLFLAALLFGVWLRVSPAFQADFPLNDGGMFYVMIRDLRANHYALPLFTTYNNLNIPFTYPPLPFYLAGGLADLFHISDLSVLLWLPALVNILTIPAFALLAQAVLANRLKSALATLIYAIMPLSMDWFLMGGGLTRGLGQLFLILTCWGTFQIIHARSRLAFAATVFSGAMVIFSHPESALLTITCAGTIWLFSNNKRETFPALVAVCAGIVLLCAPWLVTVLRAHGTPPFLQAMQTNGNKLFLWVTIFPFNFTQETGLTLLGVLGLVGLFIKLGRREFLLPVWVVLPFFINPRSSARASILPLALLVAWVLIEVILPAMRGTPGSRSRNIAANAFTGYLLAYLLFNAYALDARMTANRLSENDRLAMNWVQQNTAANSEFIILTSETQLMRDPVQEWFPALAERRSQTTLQGWEWLDGEKFMNAFTDFQGLKDCLPRNTACLFAETEKLGMSFDHVYINKQPLAPGGSYSAQNLVSEMEKMPGFQKIYENSAVVIFDWNE